MDPSRIYTKTSRGILDGNLKASALTREHARLLASIDGKADVSTLLEKNKRLSENRLAAIIDELVSGGFIRLISADSAEEELGFSSTIIVDEANTQAFFEAQAAVESQMRRAEDREALTQAQAREALLKEVSADIAAEAAELKRQDAASRAQSPTMPVKPQAAAVAKAPSHKPIQNKPPVGDKIVPHAAHAKTHHPVEKPLKPTPDAKQSSRAESAEIGRLEKESAAVAGRELEAKIRFEEEAQRHAEMEVRLREMESAKIQAQNEVQTLSKELDQARVAAELETRVKRRLEARAREEADTRARLEAEAQAKLEAEARLRAEAEAKALAEAEAKARAEAEAAAKLEAERKARIEAEERAQAEAEARAKAEAEAQARLAEEKRAAEEARIRGEEEARRQAAAEAAEKLEIERKARIEAEQRAHAEAAARAKAEVEAQARLEAEKRMAEEARIRAEEDARRQAAEQALRQAEAEARLETERKARLEAEEIARAEAQARLEAEVRAAEEVRMRAEEEARRQAEAEAEAKLEVERKARIEAERALAEAEAQAAREAEKRAAEEAQKRVSEEARRLAEVAAAQEKLQAEQQARAQAEALAQQQALELAQRQAEAEALAIAAAEEAVRQEVETQKRLVAEQEREAEVLRISEAAARALEEEREARAQAEMTAQSLAAERAQMEQAAKSREQERKRAREDANAKARAEMEEATHRAEEEKAREAREEARLREEAEARAQAAAKTANLPFLTTRKRKPFQFNKRLVKPIAATVLGLLVLLVALAHVVSFGFYIPKLEQRLTQSLGQRVAIQDLHFSSYPMPHWELGQITIGDGAGLRIAKANLFPTLSSWFSDAKSIQRAELEGMNFSENDFAAISAWRKQQAQAVPMQFEHLQLKDAKFSHPLLDVFSFNADMEMRHGRFAQAQIQSSDQRFNIKLLPLGETLRIELDAIKSVIPFEPRLPFASLKVLAEMHEQVLTLKTIDAQLLDGYASGAGEVSWSKAWNLKTDLELKQIDVKPTLGYFTHETKMTGTLEAKLRIVSQSNALEFLFAAPQVQATFRVKNGEYSGVDLVRAIQAQSRGGNIGGKTHFTDLTGYFQYTKGRYQYRQLKLLGGVVSAFGNLEIGPEHSLTGLLVGELQTKLAKQRMAFNLSGSLGTPALKLTSATPRSAAALQVPAEAEEQ